MFSLKKKHKKHGLIFLLVHLELQNKYECKKYKEWMKKKDSDCGGGVCSLAGWIPGRH